ncbi:MAG TPA: GNAT family N-acetyltransferase, partial [Dehalococcoidia bacterium]|nr:GNAT family N-acetyltransferase [Dehalococcoidia bacterium]
RRIYAEGIATGNATFDREPGSWAEWSDGVLDHSRLVARNGSDLDGWAVLKRYSKRECYAGVAETSIYVGQAARGSGLGRAILQALIESSEEEGIWTLIAGIFPENEASLRLHRSLGFVDVGRHVRIGQLNGVWRDTLKLERRSSIAGL